MYLATQPVFGPLVNYLMKISPKFFWCALVPPSGFPHKFFQEGKNDILLVSLSFQVADDAMQIDVRKTLHLFCDIKKMPNVLATVANRVPSKKIYTE